MNVTFYAPRNNWKVEFTLSGARKRRFFASKELAQAFVARSKRDSETVGRRESTIPAQLRADVVEILDECRQLGVSLREVWTAYVRGQVKPTVSAVSLGEAKAQTLDARRLQGRRGRYLESLDQYLDMFVRGREAVSISSVTPDSLREWFRLRKEKPATMASNMGRLSSMFSLGVKRGWIERNPVESLEKPHVDQPSPQILSVPQCRKLMEAAIDGNKGIVPYIVLGLFCGLRPEEASQLQWSDIRLDSGTIIVQATTSKRRSRRIVTLHKTAIEWLRWCGDKRSFEPVFSGSKSTLRREKRRLATILGFKTWPQDILRHTAASHLLTHYQSAEKTALELGNSSRILFKHYRELVTAKESSEFWSILPK